MTLEIIERPAAGVVFISASTNRVLLLCRPDGTWGLPAGSIEENETPEEAARRETCEETGYTPLMPLRNIGKFENLRAYTTRCEQFPVLLNDEHCGFGWFDVAGLPSPLHRTTADVVAAALADGIAMDARDRDINGWLEIEDNPIMAVGVFPYLGKHIKGAPDPNKFYMVYRPEEEVSDPECMASFRLMPWIDNHSFLGDGDDLTPVEAKPIEGVIGERIYYDAGSKQMKANLKVWTSTHEKRINEGKRELSLGYRSIFEYAPGEYQGVRYDYVQRIMRGNHLASVDDGRSGPDIAVTMDAKDFSFITDSMEYQTMSKQATPMTPKIKRVSNILAGLMQFVKDEADTADEATKGELAQLGELVEAAAPIIQQIAEIGVVASGEAEEGIDDEIVVDEEDDKTKKPGDDTNKPAGDKTMDARDVQKIVDRAVKAALKGMQPVQDAKDVIASIRRGATMAEQASRHIGNFDAVMDGKDWSEQEVAEYVVKTAGIPNVSKGQEIGAVHAWMHGRVAPMDRALQTVQDGKDKGAAGETPDFIKRFTAGK